MSFEVEISDIDFPVYFNDRQYRNEHEREMSLLDLAASIKSEGLLHPVVLAKKTDGRYVALAGKRRIGAYRLLYADGADDKYSSINATIIEISTGGNVELEGIRKTIHENIKRKDIDHFGFAMMFAVALTATVLKEKATEIDVRQFGINAVSFWHAYEISKQGRSVFSKDKKAYFSPLGVGEMDIISAVDDLKASLGLSSKTIIDKVFMLSYDELLISALSRKLIAFGLARDLNKLQKKEREKYEFFKRDAILLLNDGKVIDELAELYIKKKQTQIMLKKELKEFTRRQSAIVEAVSKLSMSDPKYKEVTEKLEAIEKTLGISAKKIKIKIKEIKG